MRRMNVRNHGCGNDRGIALIIVLAVLFVLAMLATTFVTMQSTEIEITRKYSDEVRARMLAQSGIEEAATLLRDILVPEGDFFPEGTPYPAWTYWGDAPDKGTKAPNVATLLEDAVIPSLAYQDAPVQDPTDPTLPAKRIMVEGKQVGFSGVLSTSTHGANSDIYKLKVLDCNSQINLNEGVEQGVESPATKNLRRILNVLGDVNTVDIPGLGTMLIDNNHRPKSGWKNKYELISVPGMDQTKFDKIKNFVTTNSWVDKSVANPVPLSADVLSAYPVGSSYYRGEPAIYRYGSAGAVRGYDNKWKPFSKPMVFAPPANPREFDHAIYAMDELNPVYVELTSRAPININLAPREVLIAVLAGLQGFFVVEQRRDTPLGSAPTISDPKNDGYAWTNVAHTYSPADKGISASGYLYATLPILGPSASGTVVAGTGIQVESIAEEIMACRSKKKSAVTGIDYATVTYGGLFRTWRQFNQFCDGLVGKLFVDDRDIYFDHVGGKKISSPVQKDIAAQAIADALKANFNPNLHLNELNPDKNLFLHVDKTDLICNSTEFCFTPMGYFEIEALGMVLEPVGSNDSFTATDNKVRGTKELEMIVKLFDAHRETSQADFALGTLSQKSRAVTTSNGLPIEIGPEVPVGGIQKEGNATGYIALPTVGGNDEPIDPNSFAGTPEGAMELDSVIYANFSRDFKARYHNSAKTLNSDLLRNDVSNINVSAGTYTYAVPKPEADQFSHPSGWDYGTPGSTGKRELTKNHNDKSETQMGPYGPADDPSPQGRFRLIRSFQMPKEGEKKTSKEGEKKPSLELIAASDHRIDGIHSERGSAPAYWIDEGISWDSMHGVVAFWVKPNFHPEMAGKPRIFFSAARWHWSEPNYMNPTPFGVFFFPAHDTKAGVRSGTESLMLSYNNNKVDIIQGQSIPDGPNAIGRLRPASLGFGIAFKGWTGYNLDLDDGYYADDPTIGLNSGVVTPSLNHSYHTDCTYTVTSTEWQWQTTSTYCRRHRQHYSRTLVPVQVTQTKSLATANVLRAHGWMHVVAKWTMVDDLEKNYGWIARVFVRTGGSRRRPTGYYEDQEKYCWPGAHTFKDDFHTHAGAQAWHWDIYVDGKEMPRTAKGLEDLVPYRRPPFSIHSYEASDDGAISPYRPKGKYVDGTMEVTRYNRVRKYREEEYNRPVYATRTATRPVRVFVGYEPYTYYVTIREKTGETEQVTYESEQVGTKKEIKTITETVQVGTEKKTVKETVRVGTKKVPQKFWEKVGEQTEWYRDPPGSYNFKSRQKPVFDWVERMVDEPVYETREKTINVPIYGPRTREIEIITPIYEWKKKTSMVDVFTYRTEPRTGQRPVYRWEDREYQETYISGYVKDKRQVPYYVDEPYVVTVATKKWVGDKGKNNIVANTIRLGENSTHGFDSLPYPRNWAADATIDEFYLWNKEESNVQKFKGNCAVRTPCRRHGSHTTTYASNVHLSGYTVTNGPSVAKAIDLYKRGRYYRTDDDEAIFTSAAIDLTKVFPAGKGRTMPPAAVVNNASVETPQGITPMKSMTGAGYRIIGVAWTWHGEAVDGATGRPALYDYKDSLDPKPIYPEVKVGFIADGQTYGPFTNDAFSAIRTAKGGNLTIAKPEDVKYTVTIDSKGDLNTVLLATPYFDDITLYVAVEPEIVTICWR